MRDSLEYRKMHEIADELGVFEVINEYGAEVYEIELAVAIITEMVIDELSLLNYPRKHVYRAVQKEKRWYIDVVAQRYGVDIPLTKTVPEAVIELANAMWTIGYPEMIEHSFDILYGSDT